MTDELVQHLSQRIVRQFSPEKIILFGSRALGHARADSDVDLLVVMPAATHRRHTAIAIRRILADCPVPKDIIVTTAAQLAQRAPLLGTIEHAATHHGIVVYVQP